MDALLTSGIFVDYHNSQDSRIHVGPYAKQNTLKCVSIFK